MMDDVAVPAEPAVTVVMVAYLEQPLLVPAVEALLASAGVRLDVIVVDNGCSTGDVAGLASAPGVEVIGSGVNVGFAVACNRGLRHATGQFVAFVNCDVLVEPDTLALLAAAAGEEGVGLVTPSIRLMDDPDVINAAGNPVHFSGLSWAGGLGQPATGFRERRDVASVSGAVMLARRTVLVELGGFCEEMFTYGEDTDLSLRAWLAGLRVVFVPDARSRHAYEFSRHGEKFYLLERNRLFMVLTVFGPGLLLAIVPVVVPMELAILVVAARQGWARQVLHAWWWLLRHPGLIGRRRRAIRGRDLTADAALARMLTSTVDPGVDSVAVPRFAQRVLDVWWRVARLALT